MELLAICSIYFAYVIITMLLDSNGIYSSKPFHPSKKSYINASDIDYRKNEWMTGKLQFSYQAWNAQVHPSRIFVQGNSLNTIYRRCKS